jgi:hypothetical protein
MAKKRAFVRYGKNGKLVPGSLIVTQGTHPDKPSTWKEVAYDICCDNLCISLYAISLSNNEGVSDSKAFYINRDLQNILEQCITPALAIGTEVYVDSLGTVPIEDGFWFAKTSGEIQTKRYMITAGIITTVTCLV